MFHYLQKRDDSDHCEHALVVSLSDKSFEFQIVSSDPVVMLLVVTEILVPTPLGYQWPLIHDYWRAVANLIVFFGETTDDHCSGIFDGNYVNIPSISTFFQRIFFWSEL